MNNLTMTQKIIIKPSGFTMNQIIQKYLKDVSRNETLQISKVCFAGRLDPMARGEILLLFNDECKNINNYKNLTKTYQFDIILGIQTTSDDPLGVIKKIDKIYENKNTNNELDSLTLTKLKNQILDAGHPKTFLQKFHNYSSKCVNGQPLWYYAKNNIEIDLPTHDVSIYDFKIFDIKKYDFLEWKQNIINQIKTIDSSCDFNQTFIIDQWNNLNLNLEMEQFIYSFPCEIKVSGGFYVRQFVRDLINITQMSLLTYDINRIKIHNNND
jgi:tRNA U55 pseudouridine synthase TruB